MNAKHFLLIGCFSLLFSGCPFGESGGGGGGGGGGLGLSGSGGSPPGDTGTAVESLLENPLSSLCLTPNGTLFLTSFSGNILASADGGASFMVVEGEEFQLNASHCDQTLTTGSMAVWFVGDGGLIKFYDGSTLETQTSGSTENLRGVYGNSTTQVFAVGGGGEILRFDGGSWNAQTDLDMAENLRAVSGKTLEVVAVGDNATIVRNTTPQNFSTTWSSVGVPVDIPGGIPGDTRFNDVWVDPSSEEVFAVGNGGVILHRISVGFWERQAPELTTKELFGVHGLANNLVLAVGEDNAIFSYDGNEWQANPLELEATFDLYDVLWTPVAAYVVGATGTTSTSTGIILQLNASGWFAL